VKGKENNARFTELVDKLKEIKGFTYKAIEDKLGIDKNKRRSIKNYTTTIEEDLINKIFEEFPELYEIENQKIEKPKSQKLQISELKERILALEQSSDQQQTKLVQLEYILNNLLKDIRLMGELNQLIEDIKKDPTDSDLSSEWSNLLSKFQSGLGSDESG
jgi:hypothetical protein